MSKRMQVPLSQVRHSNVAVVRLNHKGKRLEIACYKNKVIAYRNGTEDVVDDVIQIDRVFTDVGKGEYASQKLIQQVLGKGMTERQALEHILKHGDLQVSQAERTGEVEEMLKEICTTISEKCINATTQRPYPVSFILATVKKMGISVKLDHSVKKQALQFIHQIIEEQPIPIRRAPMLLRCSVPNLDDIHAYVESCPYVIVHEDPSIQEKGSVLLMIEPALFREVDHLCREKGGAVQVLQAAVMVTSVGDAEDFEADGSTMIPMPPPAPASFVEQKHAEMEVHREKEEKEKAAAEAERKATEHRGKEKKRKRREEKEAEERAKKEEEEKEQQQLDSSDEELLVSKKDRMKMLKKQEEQKRSNYNSEDDFDYGDGEEEEEEEN